MLQSSCQYSKIAYVNRYKSTAPRRTVLPISTYGYIIESPDEIVCTFRGTMLLKKDIQTVIDIRHHKWDNGICWHQGFSERFKSIKPQLHEYMKNKKGKPLRLVGHSMGGAMAVMAATQFYKKHPVTVHTFGCPMFANMAVYELFLGIQHVSVQLQYDIIPIIPIHPSFLHLPNTLVLTDKGVGSCLIKKNIPEDILKIGLDVQTHHSCEAYYDTIQLYHNMYKTN